MKKKTRLKRWQESELRNWVHPSGVIDPVGIRESMKQEIAKVLEEVEGYLDMDDYAGLYKVLRKVKKEYGIEEK